MTESRSIREVLYGNDFAYEAFRMIAHEVQERGGTMRHLRSMADDPIVRGKIAEAIVPQGLHGEVDYTVHVSYRMPREKEDLEALFTKNHVSEIFFSDAEWQPSPLCPDRIGAPGDKTLCLKQFTDVEIRELAGYANEAQILGSKVIKWGMDRGLVPCNELEVFAFGTNLETRDLSRLFWIVGLGSFAQVGGERVVSTLWDCPDGLAFGTSPVEKFFSRRCRFLFRRAP